MERYTKLWSNFCEKFVPSKEELKKRAELCKNLWPAEVDLSICTSNQLLEDIFLFQLPWDMEQTVEPVQFKDGIDWAFFPGEDEEFTFQMNRHRYWICLGQAYQMTGEEKYAECFVRQLLDWLDKEPLRESAYNHTWRTIEAGLRADYWCRAMALFAHSPAITEEVIERFFKGLEDHAVRISTNPRVGFSMKSNWGVLEYTGLYLLSFVLDKPEYLDMAKSFIKIGLNVQVAEDGMQWEASPMYHNEVLMCMQEAIRFSRIFNDELFDESELELIRKMGYVDMIIKNPDHKQPMVGDSDDTDLRDMITQTAYLFMDGTLKFGGFENLDYESIWLYGTEGFESYAKLESIPEPAGLVHLEASGQVVLRNGWDKNNFWLYYVNGPEGGGHGHSDKLHFAFWMDGDEILADPGRYTYTDTQPRYDLKHAISHNVPMVDREEYAPCVKSWSCAALPISIPNRVCQKGIFTLIEGGHTGYSSKGVMIDRRIVTIGEDVVVVCDEFIGPQAKQVTQRFHFGEQIVLEKEGTCVKGHGDSCQFHMYNFAEAAACEATLEEGLFSRHYNDLSSSAVADVTVSGKSSLTSFFLRSTEKPVQIESVPVTNFSYGPTLSAQEAEGYIIHIGDVRYGLVLSHRDAGQNKDFNGFENVYGLGRTMACCFNDHPKYMTVLQW